MVFCSNRLEEVGNYGKVRSQVSNYTKSNNYELIDPFCLIIALNCDALRVGLLPTVNPGGGLQQIGEINK